MFGQFAAPGGGFQNPLEDPANRRALMMFAARMLQPIQPGQTLMGQVGTGIGDAIAGKAAAEDRELRRADTNFDRQLAMMGIGLQKDKFAADREDVAWQKDTKLRELDIAIANATSEAERNRLADQRAERELQISQQNADSTRISALKPTSTSGQITPNVIVEMRQAALDAYPKHVEANTLASLPITPQEDFVKSYIQEALQGVDPDAVMAGGQTGPSLIAAPKGDAQTYIPKTPAARIVNAPQASEPSSDPGGQKMSSNQFKMRYPRELEKLKALLQDPDPKVVAKGRLILQKLKDQNISDPANFGF